jgi:hypothetical protein
MPRFAASLLAILTLVTTFASQSCSPGGCNTIGCGPAAWIEADVPGPQERLQGATLTVCHNDECRSGVITFSSPLLANSFVGVTLPAPTPSPDAEVVAPVEAGVGGNTADVQAIFVRWLPFRNGTLRNGDVYRVNVTDKQGSVILALSETVSGYEVSHPNGESCAPTCQGIHIDRRSPRPDGGR